jgi:hypothetical protein
MGAGAVCAFEGHMAPQKQERARVVTGNDHNHIHHFPSQQCIAEPAITTDMPENDLGMSWMFLPTAHGCCFSILFLLESAKNSNFIKTCPCNGDTLTHFK